MLVVRRFPIDMGYPVGDRHGSIAIAALDHPSSDRKHSVTISHDRVVNTHKCDRERKFHPIDPWVNLHLDRGRPHNYIDFAWIDRNRAIENCGSHLDRQGDGDRGDRVKIED